LSALFPFSGESTRRLVRLHCVTNFFRIPAIVLSVRISLVPPGFLQNRLSSGSRRAREASILGSFANWTSGLRWQPPGANCSLSVPNFLWSSVLLSRGTAFQNQTKSVFSSITLWARFEFVSLVQSYRFPQHGSLPATCRGSRSLRQCRAARASMLPADIDLSN
jgi:hypothetical protein